jgi:hypothetical protein
LTHNSILSPSNGGKYCLGETKKYNVCNPQVNISKSKIKIYFVVRINDSFKKCEISFPNFHFQYIQCDKTVNSSSFQLPHNITETLKFFYNKGFLFFKTTNK